MKTELLPAGSRAHIRRAADVVQRGGLVAFPTDTVYGLGTGPFDEAAVTRLYAAKDRPLDKAIPVLLASLEQIGLVAAAPGPRALALAARFWPGPLTIVVPKHPRVPAVVADQTIGIRIPNHPVALALLSLSGPLAVTSANLSGRDSPRTAVQVRDQLDGRVDLILDGGPVPGGTASTVVDCTGPELVVLRAGPISLDSMNAALA